MIPSPLKVCYALTSGPDDKFADMAFISASIVRRMYPQAPVVLLVDSTTDAHLKSSKARIVSLADEYICVPTTLSGEPASRFVKTQQRQLIKGDYLFIDVDTIPTRPFDDLFQKPIVFGAALNVNPYTYENPVPHFIEKEYRALGWEVPEAGWTAPTTPYINSGVMFWSDTPLAQELGQEWHKRWAYMYEKSGRFSDQPSLFAAFNALRTPVTLLDHEYNFLLGWPMNIGIVGPRIQINDRREKLRKARIWHFAGPHAQKGTLLSELVERFRSRGEVDWNLLDTGIKDAMPFVDAGRSIERNLFMGRWLNAAKLRLSKHEL